MVKKQSSHNKRPTKIGGLMIHVLKHMGYGKQLKKPQLLKRAHKIISLQIFQDEKNKQKDE